MSKYSTLISQIYRVDTGNIPKEVQFLPCVARLIKSPWNINFSKRSWTNLRSYHKCFNFCVAQWEESFLFRNPCPANGSRFPNELQGKMRYLLPFNFWCTSYMERISVWVWSLFAFVCCQDCLNDWCTAGVGLNLWIVEVIKNPPQPLLLWGGLLLMVEMWRC